MIRLLNVYFPVKGILLLLSEGLIVSGSFLCALWLLQGQDAFITLNYEYGWVKIGLITGLTVTLSYYFDLYEPTILFDQREIYFRILLLVGVVCFIVSMSLRFFPVVWMGRNVYSVSFVFIEVALLVWRRLYLSVTNTGLFREHVYVLGDGEHAENIIEAIRSRPDLGMEVVGCNSSATNPHGPQSVKEAVEHLLKKPYRVDRGVIAIQDRRAAGLPTADLLRLRFKGVVLEESSSLMERIYGRMQLDGLRASSFLYVEGFRIRPSQQFSRQAVSFLAAACGLLLVLPALPFIIFAVRLSSPGPIFFSQVRVGQGGKHFKVYKFRSMRTDAEAKGAQWASKNDPRVTRFGNIMRKTRIDEIPQLWNVLRGDMSLVGPRPERPEFISMLAEKIPFYSLRHEIRPGLTGWAQVRYGYGATLEESRRKLEYDLYYLKHASLGLDLLIMFETIKIIVRRRGAQ